MNNQTNDDWREITPNCEQCEFLETSVCLRCTELEALFDEVRPCFAPRDPML